MNKLRLFDLIVNINETVVMMDKAFSRLDTVDDDLKLLIKSSVKQSFLEFFILVESFTSMCLKEFRIYKMSDDMEKSLIKLNEKNVINRDMLEFLNQYRRYRNRVAHVYKQPTVEEIIEFITNNKEKIDEIINIMNEMYKNC